MDESSTSSPNIPSKEVEDYGRDLVFLCDRFIEEWRF